MFRSTKSLIAAAGLTGLLALGFSASAEGPEEREGRQRQGNRIMAIVKSLDLNEKQETMVKGFKAERKERREDKRAASEDLRDTIKGELTSGRPDARVLHKAMDDLEALHANGKHAMIDNLLELYATFDQDQVREFEYLVNNPPERVRGEGRGRGNRGQGRDR